MGPVGGRTPGRRPLVPAPLGNDRAVPRRRPDPLAGGGVDPPQAPSPGGAADADGREPAAPAPPAGDPREEPGLDGPAPEGVRLRGGTGRWRVGAPDHLGPGRSRAPGPPRRPTPRPGGGPAILDRGEGEGRRARPAAGRVGGPPSLARAA